MGRVLVVEDDQGTRVLVRASLKDGNVEVREAATLAEARDELEAFPPDVVVLDLQLPDGEGFQLLRSIPRRTPVVAMTGSGRIIDVPGRVVSFLPKPFDSQTLEWLVRSAMRPNARFSSPNA